MVENSETEPDVLEGDKFLRDFETSILSKDTNVQWSEVAGLEDVKDVLNEAVVLPIQNRQSLTGVPTCCKRILLIGSPGTGKTYIVKALATQVNSSTFFSVSSSDLVSKWMETPEKLIQHLFEMARARKPSIIFIDEIDMLCQLRLDNESVRSIKMELLSQIKNVDNTDEIFLLGATNAPWFLDSDVLQCFRKCVYVPLPHEQARLMLLKHHLGEATNDLTQQDIEIIANRTEGYTGADIISLTRDALMHSVRKVQSATHFKKTAGSSPNDENTIVDDLFVPCDANDAEAIEMSWTEIASEKLCIPPATMDDVLSSLSNTKPTVDKLYVEKLNKFVRF